ERSCGYAGGCASSIAPWRPTSCKAGVGDGGRALERAERESLLLSLSTGVLEVDGAPRCNEDYH
ncbi:unnamed protein product, partial [Ectocarpus sp. 12 AP-2014]